MKSRDMVRLNALREIKDNLTKARTSGEAYTEEAETKAMIKLVKQYQNAIAEYEANNAIEMVKKFSADLEIIKEFAPKEVSKDDIIKKVNDVVDDMINNGISLSMKEMRNVMAEVKKEYPSADGGVISQAFKARL